MSDIIFPATIRVGAKWYDLRFLEEGELEQLGRVGQTSYRDGRIDVSRGNRTMDAVCETIIHECLHAIIDDSGIEIQSEDEESIIRHISPRIAAWIYDNSDLMNAIRKGLQYVESE